MQLHDILNVLLWWGVLFGIGVAFIPLTNRFFHDFFDRGYAFSRILGTVIISYMMLCLGMLRLVSFSFLNILLILLWLTVFQIIIGTGKDIKGSLKTVKLFLKQNWFIFLFEELLFGACLFFWSYIRTFAPDIHGLEKYMDFGFVNSILRSTYFPPADMWYTPLPINYYYFGHFMTAMLTKLSTIPSAISFNLMIATLFALTAITSFSFGLNIWSYFLKSKHKSLSFGQLARSSVIVGILVGFLVTAGGNLHTVYTLFKPYENEYPKPLTQLAFSPMTFPNAYWYPNATRFIYHTIHEFPLYSFVVSDLHGHVLDIPLVITALALLFAFMQKTKPIKKSSKPLILQFLLNQKEWIFYGFLLGVMYMTNAWDGLIYFLISLPVIFFTTFTKGKSLFLTLLTPAFVSRVILVFASFILFSLPFSLFFKPFASQIGLMCAPPFLIAKGAIGPFVFESNHCTHSPLWQLVILYGFFLFWLTSLGILTYITWKKTKKILLSDAIMLLFGAFGIFLILLPEFVYLKDIYTTYYRANTMFKLVYQAFIILSLVSGYSLARIFFSPDGKSSLKRKLLFLPYTIVAMGILALVSMYPYFAIGSYYNNLKTPVGLDGEKYLADLYPSDFDAMNWLNAHIAGQPVIIEAQGDSYTDYARVSANTGLPTVLGWTVHEWLWRGTYDIAPPRIDDITTFYETSDITKADAIAKKYKIALIFVGELERKKYEKLNEKKFLTMGHAIYSKGLTTIYQLAPVPVISTSK